MDLFTLIKPTESNSDATFYSRDPNHIIDLTTTYHNKHIDQLDDPKIAWWAKRILTLEDIEKVESGRMFYHDGTIDLRDEAEIEDRNLQVTDDFSVIVGAESFVSFDKFRKDMIANKRGDLYKARLSGMFKSLYFLPEDITKAIVDYDLSSI